MFSGWVLLQVGPLGWGEGMVELSFVSGPVTGFLRQNLGEVKSGKKDLRTRGRR